MQSIHTLKDVIPGVTAFVVGNGLSRRNYDIRELRNYGLIFACNEAHEEFPVDYLGFRDDDAVPKVLGFKGNMITHESCVTSDKHAEDLRKLPNQIITFRYRPTGDPSSFVGKLGQGEVVKGSTGFIMVQLAFQMGCDPIVLVGCDCCRLEGEKTSNIYYDDSDQQGIPVRMNNFKNQYNWFIGHAKERGRAIYKLGDYGAVDAKAIELDQLIALQGKNTIQADNWIHLND